MRHLLAIIQVPAVQVSTLDDAPGSSGDEESGEQEGGVAGDDAAGGGESDGDGIVVRVVHRVPSTSSGDGPSTRRRSYGPSYQLVGMPTLLRVPPVTTNGDIFRAANDLAVRICAGVGVGGEGSGASGNAGGAMQGDSERDGIAESWVTAVSPVRYRQEYRSSAMLARRFRTNLASRSAGCRRTAPSVSTGPAALEDELVLTAAVHGERLRHPSLVEGATFQHPGDAEDLDLQQGAETRVTLADCLDQHNATEKTDMASTALRARRPCPPSSCRWRSCRPWW